MNDDTDVRKQIIAQAVTNTLTDKWDKLMQTCPWRSINYQSKAVCNGIIGSGANNKCTKDNCAVLHFIKGGL